MKLKVFSLLAIMLVLVSPDAISQGSAFTRVFWGPSSSMLGYDVIPNFDAGYLISGETTNHSLLLNLDQQGNIAWCKKISITNHASKLIRAVRTSDSCYVAVGNLDNGDMLFLKLNQNGDTLWSKSIDLGYNEHVLSICQAYDNGFLLAGICDQGSAMPASRMAVVKLDNMGNHVWTTLLAIGTLANEANSVRATPDSGCIVAGSVRNIGEPFASSLVKLTATGNISWSKKLNFPSLFPGTRGNDACPDNSGFLCYTDADGLAVLIKTDLSGNVLWSRFGYGGGGYLENEIPRPALHRTSGNGYVFVTPGPLGAMVKLDSAGQVDWSHTALLDVQEITESVDHGFLTLGNGPLYGVMAPGQFGQQIGIIKSDSTGTSNDCIDQGYDYSDTVTVTFIPATATLSACNTIVTLLHPHVSDALLNSRTGCVDMTGDVAEHYTNPDIKISVFPNPVTSRMRLAINNQGDQELKSLDIYDSMGNCVFHADKADLPAEGIDLSAQPEGLHLARIVFSGGTCCLKFLVKH